MAIKKSLLLLLALAILPLSVKAEPNAPTGFSVTGTYKLVASTPGGLTGKGYLTYKTPSDFANKPDVTVNWEIPGTAHWEDTAVVGKTYVCAGSGTKSSPTSVSCRLAQKTDSPGETNSDPSTGGGGGGSAGGTTDTPKDDSQPLNPTIAPSASKLPDLVSTKGCNTATGVYDSGLLKGVSCKGATKDFGSIVSIIKNVITMLLLPIAGTIFVLMFIVGGILYITSAGNDKRAELAKKTLTAAVVGLIIVILAFALIRIFTTIIGGSIS